jgi:hypothetical protein
MRGAPGHRRRARPLGGVAALGICRGLPYNGLLKMAEPEEMEILPVSRRDEILCLLERAA